MQTNHKIEYKTSIKAPIEKVWEALTNPTIVKEYFFGTELVTNWQVGSPVIFQGEWEGQAYKDLGEVLEYTPNKKLSFSYLSSWSGKEDLPENYLWVSYEVASNGDETELTISQTNYDAATAEHSAGNWAALVAEMKKIVE